MDVESLAKELILKNMTPEQQMVVLDSVRKSIVQAKEVQKKKIGENVDLVVQALKKIESDIRDRFDAVGNTIEKRVSSIKDGRDGANGKDGRDGKDGKSGRDGLKGDRGADGQAGRDGVDGVDGISVVNANIDFDGSLVISLSDGREINVGEVVSQDVAEKIRVISTMSTNGAIAVKEEGTTITSSVKNINFVGATVTATNSGDDVTVNVSAGTGTVTSVALSGGTTGLTVSGSPITTTGTITLAGTLAVANGGTGQSSYAVGDLLYASTTTALSKLADVATGNALISGGVGVAPSWGKVGLTTHVSGTLPTTNGGTNLTSFTSGGIVYASSTSALATSSALVFNGTNLSVGTTALSSGKFSTLADLTLVNGLVIRDSATTYANNDNYLLLQNSTGATAGGLTHPASASLGVWGNDDIRFLQGSGPTEQMRLTSTGLGIGNTNNSALLHVGKVNQDGDVAVMIGNGATSSFTASTATLQFRQGGNGGATLNAGKIVSGRTGNYSSSADADSFLAFYTALDNTDTERARIDSSGNLIQSAPTTAPTLSTNGTMVFNLTSNTNLRVSVRGSDGVTRTANLTLA